MDIRYTITCPVFDGEKMWEMATVTVENGIITYTDSGVLSSKKLTQLINEALEK